MYCYAWVLFLLVQTLFKWVGCLEQFEPIFWCLDNFIISAPHFTHIPTQNSFKPFYSLDPTKVFYSIYFAYLSFSLLYAHLNVG